MKLFHESSLILLTYKGKILLSLFESDPFLLNSPLFAQKSTWKFIEVIKDTRESFEEAIIKKVRHIAGIKLSDVNQLSSILSGGKKKYLYHARLTDAQVNNIERIEGQLLQFFSFKEIEELSLSETTQRFINKNRDFMENIYTKQASSSAN